MTAITENNISRIVSEFRKGMLGNKASTNYCFALNSALEGYLNFCGVRCELTKGYVGQCEHYWITLSDNRVIDPTADQFNDWYLGNGNKKTMPPVFIGVKPEWYKKECK